MSTNNPNYSTPPMYQGGQPAPQEVALDLPVYGISFRDAIKRYFQKYVTFSGRASKSEFWWSYLFLFIVNFIFNLLKSLTHGSSFIGILNILWSLATILPSLAIAFRRLHDANKSGGLIFVPIGLAVLGFLIVVVGGGAAFMAALSGMSAASAASAGSALAGSIGAMLFGVIIVLAAVVLMIVFMCFATNPAGARFDTVSAQPMAGPVQPAQPYDQFAQPYAPQPQQSQQQYAQPYSQPYPQQQADPSIPPYPAQPVQPAAPADPAGQYPQAAPQQYQQYPQAPQTPQYPQQPTQNPYGQYPNDPNNPTGPDAPQQGQ